MSARKSVFILKILLVDCSWLAAVRAGIEEGDLLVVEEDDAPPGGAVVVVLVEGGEEVMAKRLYREGDLVKLRSENDGYEDITLPS
ncbi:MAG: S24 family peptidase, partial [Actinomycetota bacterium]|nr:S24 family peptidase [Actinomycetota bacterium]